MGWIAVDLDGTLAAYDGWRGATVIGPPIPAMVARVKRWLDEGRDVRIFTARAYPAVGEHEHPAVLKAIEDWSREHIGRVLPITYVKDFGMEELWDDRAVSVEPNTGRALAISRRGLDERKKREVQTIDLEGCARCGGEGHPKLVFEKLDLEMEGPDGTVWEWFAICPTSGQPILMRVQPVGGKPPVFACRR